MSPEQVKVGVRFRDSDGDIGEIIWINPRSSIVTVKYETVNRQPHSLLCDCATSDSFLLNAMTLLDPIDVLIEELDKSNDLS